MFTNLNLNVPTAYVNFLKAIRTTQTTLGFVSATLISATLISATLTSKLENNIFPFCTYRQQTQNNTSPQQNPSERPGLLLTGSLYKVLLLERPLKNKTIIRLSSQLCRELHDHNSAENYYYYKSAENYKHHSSASYYNHLIVMSCSHLFNNTTSSILKNLLYPTCIVIYAAGINLQLVLL